MRGQPFITFEQHPNGFTHDGFISDDNQVAGTYLHGLFDTPDAVNQLVRWLEPETKLTPIDLNQHREQQLNRLADVVEKHMDIEQIINIYDTFSKEK